MGWMKVDSGFAIGSTLCSQDDVSGFTTPYEAQNQSRPYTPVLFVARRCNLEDSQEHMNHKRLGDPPEAPVSLPVQIAKPGLLSLGNFLWALYCSTEVVMRILSPP